MVIIRRIEATKRRKHPNRWSGRNMVDGFVSLFVSVGRGE